MRIGISTHSRGLLSRMRLISGHMLRNGDERFLFEVGEIFVGWEIGGREKFRKNTRVSLGVQTVEEAMLGQLKLRGGTPCQVFILLLNILFCLSLVLSSGEAGWKLSTSLFTMSLLRRPLPTFSTFHFSSCLPPPSRFPRTFQAPSSHFSPFIIFKMA